MPLKNAAKQTSRAGHAAARLTGTRRLLYRSPGHGSRQVARAPTRLFDQLNELCRALSAHSKEVRSRPTYQCYCGRVAARLSSRRARE